MDTSEALFGEADYVATDKEWEEFAKLVEKKKKMQDQAAFYPCPPQEEDYVSPLVSWRLEKQTNDLDMKNFRF